jgi:biotin carboxyl carrier protein
MATITIDGVRRNVDVKRDGEGYVVTVDGRAYTVKDVSQIDGGHAFMLDRTSHAALVSSGVRGVELSMDGRTYAVSREAADADRPASARGRGGDERLEAPMPGSIIAVNVAAGDRVHAGQALVVLESMKMHNEITAPHDGVVHKVHCRVGEQVGFGHVLVEIGPEVS